VKTKDFDGAKELMADVVALKVIRLDKLKKGAHYQIRMKAELDKIELPFYLNYVLFFYPYGILRQTGIQLSSGIKCNEKTCRD